MRAQKYWKTVRIFSAFVLLAGTMPTEVFARSENLVSGKVLKDRTVRGRKLVRETITDQELAPGAVTPEKVQPGADGQVLQTTGTVVVWGAVPSDGDWNTTGSDLVSGVSGNVGIGSATPGSKLDVGGSITASGNIRASGTIQSGNSIIIDGVNNQITSSVGSINFDNEVLETTDRIKAAFFEDIDDPIAYFLDMTSTGKSLRVAGKIGVGTDPLREVDVIGTVRATTFEGDGSALTNIKGGVAYDNVVVVAKSGGDFDTITSALASITDATATNRYLVWVAPGTYNEQVLMNDYVDIEGAGEDQTVIDGSGMSAPVVIASNHSEIRFLRIENLPDEAWSSGIGVPIGYTNFSALHVTISTTASGGPYAGVSVAASSTMVKLKDLTITLNVTGTVTGIWSDCNLLEMRDCFMEVNGYDVTGEVIGLNTSAAGTQTFVTDCHIGALNNAAGFDTGVYVDDGKVLMDHCVVYGMQGYAVYVEAPGVANMGASLLGLWGGTGSLVVDTYVAGPGTATCASCYDETYQRPGTDLQCP